MYDAARKLFRFTINNEPGVVVTNVFNIMFVTLNSVFFLNLFVEDVSTLKVIEHVVDSVLTASEFVREDFSFSVDNCL